MHMKATATDELSPRDWLVVKHVGLVKSVAAQVATRVPAHVDLAELTSAGALGLLDAAGRYKPALGVPFGAFARRRIHGAMLDALRDADWVPRSARKLRRELDATIRGLRSDLGREPQDHQIAAALHLSEPEYLHVLDKLRKIEVPLVRQAAVGEGNDELELAVDPSEDPYSRLERSEITALLATAVAKLPARERHVLALYYHDELTQARIGQVLGVGEARVSQLRARAITRLRKSFRATRLTKWRAPSNSRSGDSVPCPPS